MFWASTLRAKKNGHHHSNDFRKNYIRHEGVSLHSSHVDPKQTMSHPPPEVARMRSKFNEDNTIRDRRRSLHITALDAPWANISPERLDGNFRK